MNITFTRVDTEVLDISESDILKILKEYIIQEIGPEWNNSSISIFETTLPTGMGDIDDRTEIVAKAKLITTSDVDKR